MMLVYSLFLSLNSLLSHFFELEPNWRNMVLENAGNGKFVRVFLLLFVDELKVEKRKKLNPNVWNREFGKLIAEAMPFAEREWHKRFWMSFITTRRFEKLVIWIMSIRKEFIRLLPLIWIVVNTIIIKHD